jgi:hypothetical protein
MKNKLFLLFFLKLGWSLIFLKKIKNEKIFHSLL